MGITSIVRPFLVARARRTDTWGEQTRTIQLQQLRWLLKRARNTEYGKRYGFVGIENYSDYAAAVPRVGYEHLRTDIERVLRGESDVLWPGRCKDFAQSSGTSGGKSKYIPITPEALRYNHYAGGTDAVAHYLRCHRDAKIFDGKGLILGGSFANELAGLSSGVRVGDLSATLVERINPLANMVRVPSKRIALMADWNEKLPLLVRATAGKKITNLSGVPSWMLGVLRNVMEYSGATSLKQVWPHLEVFFHGGISFEPYRSEYARIMGNGNIRYVENYNASEGFFAVQNDPDDPAMLLLIDAGIFYEFAPMDNSAPVAAWDVEAGRTYELLVSCCNGLWRYSPGDTVEVCSTNPVKIRVAGRTKSFINAFGEEVMEWNAEHAIARACEATGAVIANYTVAPVFPADDRKGYHQWLMEWHKKPASIEDFCHQLDVSMQSVNSDYQAKRSGDLFMAKPEIVTLPSGTFDAWLRTTGNGRLGGQRKVPRLCNNRALADTLLSLYPSLSPLS